MAVDINYWWIAFLLLTIIALVYWVVKRNYKDCKQYEQEIINAENKALKHKENKDSDTTP